MNPFIRLLLLIVVCGPGLLACTSEPDASDEPPYRVETIPLPEGLVAETGGIAFLPDGRLIACFHRGEVMTYDPETEAWAKFAEGLHDPLGIAVVDTHEVLVMQRPELTRLRDTDRDGVADTYETVTDQYGMSGNYHEFAFGPVVNDDGEVFISLNTASGLAGIREQVRGELNPLGRPGRMYATAPYRGWVLRVNDDGSITPWASGFRSPNGIGFDLDGNLFVTDNQGDWLGTSKLYHVRRGHFYGHPSSLVWEEGFDVDPLTLPVAVLDKMRTKAAVLFPQGILANSPTQIVPDDTGGKFGPFEGHLFIGEMDFPRIMRVVLEEVDHELQGFAIPVIDSLGLLRGNNRLVFAPDGSLWVGHTDHGWVGDRGIQRIVWTGTTPMDVYRMSLTKTGFDLTFTRPVDAATVSDPAAYRLSRYYYQYHRPYGSDQMDVRPVPVPAVEVSSDRRRVSMAVADLVPGYVYELHLDGVTAEDGTPLHNAMMFYTLNRLRR